MAQVDLSQYKSLYLKTANEYIEKLSNSLTSLKTNPSDETAISEAHLAVHSLGSQSYTMGYNSTADLCRALEAFFHALKETHQAFPPDYLPGIEASVQKIRDSITSIESTDKEVSPIPETPVATVQSTTQLKPNLTVLLAEDDKFFQNFYARKLKEQGMRVEVASDGEEAVEKLKNVHPDIILLDLIMPKKNGFEVLQTLSTMDNLKNIPVLVFSTLEQEGDIEKAKQLGAKDYANKTFFDFDNLLSKINQLTS